MIQEIEQILLQLEVLLRGGAQSTQNNTVSELRLLSRKALVWFSNSDAGESYKACNENQRTDILALAVKLHNKVRNLTSAACVEIKTYLKATAAWMLCLYGGKNAKVLSVAVNVLSKSGRELEHYGADSDLVLRCLSGSMLYWTYVGSLSIHKDFSPVELQDMKISAFWASLEKARIIWGIGGAVEDIRKAVANAGDIMQTLPSRMKTSFAQEVVSIANKMSPNPALAEDAIYLFKTALNAIDSAMIPSVYDDVDGSGSIDKTPLASTADTKRMKLNVLLSLAFLYMKMRDTAKALGCVSSIEQSIPRTAGGDGAADAIAHTVLYAKFFIFLQDKDQLAAEGALWALLKLALTPFEMALSAVKALDGEDHGGHIDAVPFYKHLAGKYPNEPEHTVIRIHHLQTIVANVCAGAEGSEGTTKKALEITNSIVQAHIRREKVLSGENYSGIKHLISERIRWHRTQAEWEATISWCNALVALLTDSLDEKDGAVAVQVLKVDALIRQCRYAEAALLSAETFAALPNTRTILMHFKAIAHADTEQAAVDAFRAMHSSLTTATTSAIAASVYQSSSAEYLSRLVLCCQALQDAPGLSALKRDKITQLMLREWVHRYGAEQMWKEAGECKDQQDGMVMEDTSVPLRTYFGTACDYVHMYLLHIMELRPGAAQESKSMDDSGPARNSQLHHSAESDSLQLGTADSVASNVSAPVAAASDMDFFTFHGYPDSLNSAADPGASSVFTFACPLSVLRADLLVLLEDLVRVIAEVEKSGQSLSVLGSPQDLAWLERLANNLAVVLRDREGQVCKQADTPLRLVTAARLFEIAELLGSKQATMPGGACSGSESATDLAACLLNASACRIDAEPAVASKVSSSLRELTLSSVTQSGAMLRADAETGTGVHAVADAPPAASLIPPNNISQARLDAQEADRLLQALADFDDPRAKRLRNVALLLEFHAVCKLGNQRLCEDFLRERHNAFLRQSATDLQLCAHIARTEVSLEAARSLLNLALQNSVRDGGGFPDYRLMGALYCELIETSPSRRHALEKVEEFEQLASNLAVHSDAAGAADPGRGFAPDDVDLIVSRAYNNGVALVDLDQLDLAETFICKAISLLSVASPTTKGWLPKMQETYSNLLKAKTKGAGARTFCAPAFTGSAGAANTSTGEGDKAVTEQGTGEQVQGQDQEAGKKRTAAAAGVTLTQRAKEPTLQLDHVK